MPAIEINTGELLQKSREQKEILIKRDALQTAIDKYDADLRALDERSQSKNLTTKDLDEIEREYKRLEAGKKTVAGET